MNPASCSSCGEASVNDGGFFNDTDEDVRIQNMTIAAGGCPVCNTFPEDRKE